METTILDKWISITLNNNQSSNIVFTPIYNQENKTKVFIWHSGFFFFFKHLSVLLVKNSNLFYLIKILS